MVPFFGKLTQLFQGENEIEFQIEKHQILNEIRVSAQFLKIKRLTH